MQTDYKLLVSFFNELFATYHWIEIKKVENCSRKTFNYENYSSYEILYENENFAFIRELKNLDNSILIVFTD